MPWSGSRKDYSLLCWSLSTGWIAIATNLVDGVPQSPSPKPPVSWMICSWLEPRTKVGTISGLTLKSSIWKKGLVTDSFETQGRGRLNIEGLSRRVLERAHRNWSAEQLPERFCKLYYISNILVLILGPYHSGDKYRRRRGVSTLYTQKEVYVRQFWWVPRHCTSINVVALTWSKSKILLCGRIF